jgi:hypothetical protein
MWFKARQFEGTQGEDIGTFPEYIAATLSLNGVCSETVWPYDEAYMFRYPDEQANILAYDNRIFKFENHAFTDGIYSADYKINLLKQDVYYDKPTCLSIAVYDNFIPNAECHIDDPLPTSELLGWHCVALVGYDNKKRRFWFVNSWGTEWACGGFFSLSYDFITNDVWCVGALTIGNFITNISDRYDPGDEV